MILYSFYLFFLCSLYQVWCDNDYDGPLSINLYHNLEDVRQENWTLSYRITFKNLNTGTVDIKLLNWDESTSEKLLTLAKRDMLYKMKASVQTLKGRNIDFRTFTKARKLILENVITTLTVTLDYTGSVIAVTLNAIPSSRDEVISSSPIVKPLVTIRSSELGPVPDTATYIQKLEREREAKERGGNLDNRSFFAKYWMYILLVVLFAVLSGSSHGESSAQGGR